MQTIKEMLDEAKVETGYSLKLTDGYNLFKDSPALIHRTPSLERINHIKEFLDKALVFMRANMIDVNLEYINSTPQVENYQTYWDYIQNMKAYRENRNLFSNNISLLASYLYQRYSERVSSFTPEEIEKSKRISTFIIRDINEVEIGFEKLDKDGNTIEKEVQPWYEITAVDGRFVYIKKEELKEVAQDIIDGTPNSQIKEETQNEISYTTATNDQIIELLKKLDPTIVETEEGIKLIESNNKSALWKKFKELSNK